MRWRAMRWPAQRDILAAKDNSRATAFQFAPSNSWRKFRQQVRVSEMRGFLVVAVLSSVAFAQSSSGGSKSAQDPSARPAPAMEIALGSLPDLPPMPRGKSTVIGGAIREVDRVRDQFTLNVFGGRALKVLFDERTKVYRDGIKSSIRDLHAGDHVSVETVLDGTTVFARSIHM